MQTQITVTVTQGHIDRGLRDLVNTGEVYWDL